MTNYVNKRIEEVTKKSWTWKRLTEKEKKEFLNTNGLQWIEGNDKTQLLWFESMYAAFLSALNYQPIGWREMEEEK